MVKRILVIEDDDAVAELVTMIVEDAGYVADRTASADEGLARVQTARPALVLLDLTLTGTSGLNFLQRCKRDATLATLPIVVMSGTSMAATESEPAPDGEILKPFDIDELCSVIDRFAGDGASVTSGAPA